MRQRCRTAGGTLGGGNVAFHTRKPSLRHAGLQQFKAAGDADEQVVEVVRQAAGELPHRFHLLALAQTVLGLLQGFRLLLLSSEVAPHGVDKSLARHRRPVDPAIAAILVPEAVVEAAKRLSLGEALGTAY